MKTKKILASLLASVVTVASVTTLASCKKTDNPKDDEPTIEPSENNEDKKIVQAAIDKLTVDAEATGDFTLTIKGNGNVAITWASSNTEVIAIDGSNATVKRPAIGQADVVVKLTATAVLNDEQMTKEFTVTVKALEDTSSKVSEIKALADKTDVHAHGVVSGFLYASGSTDPEYKAGFYLTDETGTIYVFGSAAAKDLEVGNELYLDAVKGSRNGVAQLETPTNVNVAQETASISQEAVIKGKTVADIVELGDNSLGNVYELDIMIYQNQYGAYNIEDPNFSQSNIPFVDTNNVSVGEYFSGSASKDLTSYAALLRGNEKKILHVTYFVNSKNNSGVLRGNVLTASVVDDSKLVELAQKYIKFDETYNLSTEATLPTSFFGDDAKVTVSWTVKEGTTATISSDNKLVITPSNEENVILTATFTRGDVTIAKDYSFTTKGKSAAELVAYEKENFALSAEYGGTYELITESNGVTLSYAIKDDSSNIATIEENILKIKNVSSPTTIIITVTFTKDAATDTKDVTLTINKLDALTPTEVIEGVAAGTIVDKTTEITVKGVIYKKDSKGNLFITDGVNSFEIYGALVEGSLPATDFAVGDVVIASGKYTVYNGVHETVSKTAKLIAKLEAEDMDKAALSTYEVIINLKNKYSGGTYDLPATGVTYKNVILSYAIKEGTEAASISAGKLVLTQNSSEITVKLEITATIGETSSNANATFVVEKNATIAAGTFSATLTHPSAAISNANTKTNYASDLGLSADLFEVKVIKNAANITYFSKTDIRLYPGNSNGSGLVITLKNQEGFDVVINSIEITLNGNLPTADTTYSVNETANNDNGIYEVNSSVVTIKNTSAASKDHQVKIKSIKINYTLTAK